MSDVPKEVIPDFEGWGIRAFTTTREAGTFSLSSKEPVDDVMTRWSALQREMSETARRLVSIRQVHGSRVLVHIGGWEGWLRAGEEADGHIAAEKGIALTVGIADCVPVFIAHPSGVIALLHSGWRGTVARITTEAIAALARQGLPPDELAIHLGPAICGRCYEVSTEVREQLTGEPVTRPGKVDLRSLIAEHAAETGVQKITVSSFCTRCDNDRFFSHRAGDAGRQIAVMAAQA
ncbi:MAG: Multi-copper polyphenol oxidoreductase, laccase [Gemmatimonadales bacterium]|nr:Multi-copper polyphenol oxidoreductase, laccase [Gemmatimonadales bacterium]